MEQLKLEEAMSSVGSKSELQGQSRRCDVLANNGSGEPGCSKNIGSCLVTRAVDSRPTTVCTYAVTYSPASTVGPQAVTSTVGVLDAKPRFKCWS